MVGRGACWNPSVFRSEGKLFWEDVKREYVKKVSLHKYSLDVVILYVAECQEKSKIYVPVFWQLIPSGAKIDDHNSITAQYFGLSGLPALHPWGKEDIFITLCDWLETKGFCVVGTEYRVGQ